MVDIEKCIKKIYEYYETLESISYDEIIDTLMNVDKKVNISFHKEINCFNKKIYRSVQISNKDNNTRREYLITDQKVNDIYKNLIAAIKTKNAEPYFVIDSNSEGVPFLYCYNDESSMIFPYETARTLLKCCSNTPDTNSKNIPCRIYSYDASIGDTYKFVYLPNEFSNDLDIDCELCGLYIKNKYLK